MTNFYQFFIDHPIYNVQVNNTEYENKVGVKTSGGYYKNGYTAKKLKAKSSNKYNYIQLNMYTSVLHRVDIEEKWLIRSDNKICKRLGWHNVNLLRISKEGENKETLQAYIDSRKSKLKWGKLKPEPKRIREIKEEARAK